MRCITQQGGPHKSKTLPIVVLQPSIQLHLLTLVSPMLRLRGSRTTALLDVLNQVTHSK